MYHMARVEDRFTIQFPKHYNKGHFVMGNILYVYNENYVSKGSLKRWIAGFVKVLGYVGGVTPWDEAPHERLKLLIENRLLMDTCTKEDMRVIFGEFRVIVV